MYSKFVDQVDMELKRAERYSVFVSIVILDLSFLESNPDEQISESSQEVINKVRESIRVMDYVSPLEDNKIGLLFPETPRQGAEIVGKRISEVIRDYLSKKEKDGFDKVIPLQMASFPDAAGTITISDFLKNYSINSQN